jgi:tetratricopeptide (TPR) repeat protein
MLYSRTFNTTFVLTPVLLACAALVTYASPADDTIDTANATVTHRTVSQETQTTPAPHLVGTDRVSAYALLMNGQYAKALDVFDSVEPKTPEIYNMMGIAAEHLSMTRKARQSFEAALKMQPRYADADNNLGTLYYKAKDYKNAARYYKKCLHINHGSAVALSNLGTLYYSQKKYHKAFSLDRNVFAQQLWNMIDSSFSSAESAELHFDVARMLAQGDMPQQAMLYLQKAVSEGFHDRSRLLSEKAFTGLRTDPGFSRLLRDMQG